MCLHKHPIIHQHLYNIKGVIYKSTGIVHSAGSAGAPLRDFPTRVEPVRTEGGQGRGCPSLCLSSGRTPRAGPCWNPEPQVRLGSQSHRQASVNSLIQIQCAYLCGKIGAGDGFLSWGPRGCC